MYWIPIDCKAKASVMIISRYHHYQLHQQHLKTIITIDS